MGFYVSPQVAVKEVDLSGYIPAVQSSNGAIAGVFNWGPVNAPYQLASEEELVRVFGKPDNNTAPWFFTASSFLSYSSSLLVNRVKTTGMNSANALGASSYLIENQADFDSTGGTALALGGTFAAKYPGDLGNGLKISVADANSFSKTIGGTISTSASSAVVTGSGTDFSVDITVGGVLKFSVTVNSSPVVFEIPVKSIESGTSLTLASALPTGSDYNASGLTAVSIWEFAESFDSAPSTSTNAATFNSVAKDELHVVVVDTTGLISGEPGSLLEKYTGLSKASDGKTPDGATNYYVNVINKASQYIYATDKITDTNLSLDLLGASGTDIGGTISVNAFKQLNRPGSVSLTGGASDSANYTAGSFFTALDALANDEIYDVSLLMTGKADATVANYAIQSVAEMRKDCVAFVSPVLIADTTPIIGNKSTDIDNILAFRNATVSSSYGMLDTGYKYMYDRYNDIYRWVPLNGDIAGLCARTDYVADPWWSPGGFNRGQIKNVAKLAVSPNKTQRDTLYKANVNPVVSFPGEGPVLYGDKTMQTKPSAFDRINVRRLFIVLEKAIATAAKYQLFELNDAFTRAQFKAMVEPFLRDVQGRRGIYDFKVTCDETVNTAEVIDRNEFKAKIFIKPAKSINFIELSFIAVRSGVNFAEVAGA